MKKFFINIWDKTLVQLRSRLVSYVVVNTLLIVGHLVYVYLRFQYLNTEIPFWYARVWGETQLAPREYIYMLPLLAALLFLVGLAFLLFNRFYISHVEDVIFFFVLFSNLMLGYSAFRIIHIASGKFDPLLNPLYLKFAVPFIVGFVLMYILTPIYIGFAQRRRLITNPGVHAHPGMILQQPSARGAGIVYTFVVVSAGLLFLGFKAGFTSLFVSLIMLGILGFLDDIQNTLPSASLKFLENPINRLALMFLAVMPYILAGNTITFIGNPLGGVFELGGFSINLGAVSIPILSSILTILWVVWLLNALSWSNGIDGQYAGIIGISSFVVGVLALRFSPLEPVHWAAATLAAISAGAAFASVRFTWFPSKILWGFGAITAGMVLSALAISVQSKIVTSFLVILLPLLDSLVTAVRRVLLGKSPFSGDRGHLHHLLLDRGWSPRKIAVFYWVTTAFFGTVGLMSSEENLLKIVLALVVLVGVGITIMNWLSLKKKKQIQLFD